MIGNPSYLVEHKVDEAGGYWYRRYSDGYIELYMEVPPSQNLSNTTLQFPVTFKTDKYFVARSNMLKGVDTYTFHQHIVSRSPGSLVYPGLTSVYCSLQTFMITGY
ncbi:hypothetical protein [Salmonella phage SSBI34]|nr:hypothetical protein [Salmonella phage SSBI34]